MMPSKPFKPGPPPEEAILFFESKKIKPAFSYKAAWREEYRLAFYVAKMLEKDLLKDVQDSLTSALEEGKTFRDWSKEIRDTFDKSGWSSYADESKTPQRLEVIYDTNMRTARAAGQWERANRVSDIFTHAQWNLGPSKVHEEEDASYDGLVLPVDDPFFDTRSPPIHWGCQCWLRFITRREAEELGIDDAPPEELVEWKNNQGDTKMMPRGVSPGFGENPLKAREKILQELADEPAGEEWVEE